VPEVLEIVLQKKFNIAKPFLRAKNGSANSQAKSPDPRWRVLALPDKTRIT
jgi:hypothetical protein